MSAGPTPTDPKGEASSAPKTAPQATGGVEIAADVFVPETAVRFAYSRSSGPGGQNVNKLNTKAEVWVPLDAIRGLAPDAMQRLISLAGKRITKENELHISAETARTQEGNRSFVMDKLRELVVQAKHRPKPRKTTKPSKGAKRRRLEAKRHRGETKARRQSPMKE